MKTPIDRARTTAEQAIHGTLLLAGWNFIAADLERNENDYDVYCADGKEYGPATWELAFFGTGHPVTTHRWRLTFWGAQMGDAARRWYSDDPHALYINYRRQRERVDAKQPALPGLLT